jgi:hypothetical protein
MFDKPLKSRKAYHNDAPAIFLLLDQLGYPNTGDFLADRINSLLGYPEEELVVGKQDDVIVAVLSLYFIPQLATLGPFA